MRWMYKKALATFKSAMSFFPILPLSRRQNNVKTHLCAVFQSLKFLLMGTILLTLCQRSFDSQKTDQKSPLRFKVNENGNTKISFIWMVPMAFSKLGPMR